MCCCGKPNINGTLGYKWQPNDAPSIRPTYPPTLTEYDALLYDEPGRCGGIDSHCHHYRVASSPGGALDILVKHGGGEERIRLSNSTALKPILAALDSNSRYWILNSIAHAHTDGRLQGAETVESNWRQAAAEKRIKTRKTPRRDCVKVWIEPREIHI